MHERFVPTRRSYIWFGKLVQANLTSREKVVFDTLRSGEGLEELAESIERGQVREDFVDIALALAFYL